MSQCVRESETISLNFIDEIVKKGNETKKMRRATQNLSTQNFTV